jgi:spore coat protein U-like protein
MLASPNVTILAPTAPWARVHAPVARRGKGLAASDPAFAGDSRFGSGVIAPSTPTYTGDGGVARARRSTARPRLLFSGGNRLANDVPSREARTCRGALDVLDARSMGRTSRIVMIAVVFAALAWAPGAAAQLCTGLAATDMVFTGYTPFGAGVAATSTITYRCDPGVTQAWIAVNRSRTLRAGTQTMAFELYQAPDRVTPWLSGTLVPVPAVANGSVTVYGFLPPQDAAAGSYTATLSVRIYVGPSRWRTDTTNLRVSTSGFVPTCIIGAGTLAFGNYDPAGANAAAPLDASGTFQVACTRNASYTVGLGAGSFAAGAARRMANGTARLGYELYADAARTAVWSGTATTGGTAASIAPIALTVYGRVPAGQTVPAGAYADTVQSTINF